MCLRFAFLLITRVAAWLRLSRREDAWKTAEILILRHQVVVLQRRQPCRLKLNWADRALLAALLGLIPKARRQGQRLLVTPDGAVALWDPLGSPERYPDAPGQIASTSSPKIVRSWWWAGRVGGDVVVAAAEVLHERMATGEDPC